MVHALGRIDQRPPCRGRAPLVRCAKSIASRIASTRISWLGLRFLSSLSACAFFSSQRPAERLAQRLGHQHAAGRHACAPRSAWQLAQWPHGRSPASAASALAQPGRAPAPGQLELAEARRPCSSSAWPRCAQQRGAAARRARAARPRLRSSAPRAARASDAPRAPRDAAADAAWRGVDAHEAPRRCRLRARVAGAHAREELDGLRLELVRQRAPGAALRRHSGAGRTRASGRAAASAACTQRFERATARRGRSRARRPGRRRWRR